MGRPRKKPQGGYKAPPRKKPLRASITSTELSPQQIAVVGALLSGFFVVESVLYNRNNELKVILTSTSLTEEPVLGNKEREEEEDIPLDFIASESNLISPLATLSQSHLTRKY
ncbi:hypothetical protein P9847_09905 [Paenibacillus chibensis]|uniref:Uncharacterized protein n=1 Tax=Paenibacillus chibensis TaxID=59846 RepID=A0ABU6PUE1_9BACL|nr:hypothetical protein [Paenibacillus chibensis]